MSSSPFPLYILYIRYGNHFITSIRTAAQAIVQAVLLLRMLMIEASIYAIKIAAKKGERRKFQKKKQKVWRNEIKALPLHSRIRNGTLTDRLGNGLQNRVEQFDSARYL